MAECLCSVLCVKPYSGYYPACPKCMRKLIQVKNSGLNEDQHPNSVFCRLCVHHYSLEDISWNYCVAMTVTDGTIVSEVVTFGHRLNWLFGLTAHELHRFLLDRFSLPQYVLPLQDAIVSDYLVQAITTIMAGKIFKFHFKWQTHPCDTISTLSNVCKRIGRIQGQGGCVTASHIEQIRPIVGQGVESKTVAVVMEDMLTIKENMAPSCDLSKETYLNCLHPQVKPRPHIGNSFYDQFNDTNSTSSGMTTPLIFEQTSTSTMFNYSNKAVDHDEYRDSIGWTTTMSHNEENISENMLGQSTTEIDIEPTTNKSITGNSSLVNKLNTGDSSLVDKLIIGDSSLIDKLITGDSSLIDKLNTGNSSSLVDKLITGASSSLVEYLPDEDSLTREDYKYLVDEIKDDWLLTQPGSEPFSLPHGNQSSISHRSQTSTPHGNQSSNTSIPLGNQTSIPHRTQSCLSPFWNDVPSTQNILQENTITSSSGTNNDDQPQHNNTTQLFNDIGGTSSSITPKLKRNIFKRQVLLAKPHKLYSTASQQTTLFQPSDSSTPSVSASEKKQKRLHPQMAYIKTHFTPMSNDSNYMSPDIL